MGNQHLDIARHDYQGDYSAYCGYWEGFHIHRRRVGVSGGGWIAGTALICAQKGLVARLDLKRVGNVPEKGAAGLRAGPPSLFNTN